MQAQALQALPPAGRDGGRMGRSSFFPPGVDVKALAKSIAPPAGDAGHGTSGSAAPPRLAPALVLVDQAADQAGHTTKPRPWTKTRHDFGVFMGRSFRVGWGPNGELVHPGGRITHVVQASAGGGERKEERLSLMQRAASEAWAQDAPAPTRPQHAGGRVLTIERVVTRPSRVSPGYVLACVLRAVAHQLA